MPSLQAIFSELNAQHFQGTLPEPKLAWNSRLRSSAGRFAPGSRNPLKPRMPLIEVASYLQSIPDGELHIRDTLLHEMVHYTLWHQKKPYGHTPEFHQILKRVGARRFNPVPKETPVKYWYECPRCLTKSPARRRISGAVACLACCKKWNGGKYSEHFRLRLSSAAAPVALPKTILRPTAPSTSTTEPAPLPFSEIKKRLEDIRAVIRKVQSRQK